ncbi:MAG: PIG-L family deacetylase [Gammaproteobacteria bacterium]
MDYFRPLIMASTAADSSFDTSLHGASESAWRTWVDRVPRWQPKPGPLVVVAPHPDDETLGAGGLISAWLSRRRPVTVIAVTDGEAACPEIAGLARVRRKERARAMKALGTGVINLIELHLPDGGVSELEAQLPEALAPYVGSVGWLVAPFEHDGHPDHDAVGRACRRIATRAGLALARYPIWAWHRGSGELRSAAGVARFALTPAARVAKRRAISQFHSQVQERPGGAIVPPHVLAYFDRPYEVFVL